MRLLLPLYLITFCFSSAQEPRMLKSLSGASGHVSGPKFIFDETRTRFVYPQDKSLIVYFEWVARPGLHTISALWRSPDGHVASIPTDIKIELANGDLAAYWTFDINPSDAAGIWTLETRVDGAPGGTHNFEIYVPPVAVQPTAPRLPTRDDVYRAAVPSLALVSSLDALGQRLDTSLGFVYAQDQVATSFQGIDGASALSVTFADGTSARADSLAGWSRAEDWALIPVPTGARKVFSQTSSSSAKIGERVLAFTVEDGKTRAAAILDVTGRSATSVQLNPALPPIAAGSPVFDSQGDVIGLLGAWSIPGSRIPATAGASIPAVWGMKGYVDAATPIEAIHRRKDAVPLGQLALDSVFTQPLQRFPPMLYATTTDVQNKRSELPDRNVTEFSRAVPTVYVVSVWERREKVKSAVISTAVFDLANHKRGETAPKKVSFGDGPNRLTSSFSLAGLEPGSYRVDLIADDKVVWRCFIKVSE